MIQAPAMPNPAATPRADRYRDDLATPDERTYATFQNLVGLANIASGIPLIGLIATLIMWQIKKAQSPFLDDHGREAMNFQISLVIYSVGGIIAAVLFGIITIGIGFVLFPFLAILGTAALVIIQLIGCIRGAIAANRGEYYRYPMTIRVIPTPA